MFHTFCKNFMGHIVITWYLISDNPIWQYLFKVQLLYCKVGQISLPFCLCGAYLDEIPPLLQTYILFYFHAIDFFKNTCWTKFINFILYICVCVKMFVYVYLSVGNDEENLLYIERCKSRQGQTKTSINVSEAEIFQFFIISRDIN